MYGSLRMHISVYACTVMWSVCTIRQVKFVTSLPTGLACSRAWVPLFSMGSNECYAIHCWYKKMKMGAPTLLGPAWGSYLTLPKVWFCPFATRTLHEANRSHRSQPLLVCIANSRAWTLANPSTLAGQRGSKEGRGAHFHALWKLDSIALIWAHKK